MLAGNFTAPGQIELIDIPEPELPPTPTDGGPTQMIFQPECTCLCGSDLPYFKMTDEWPIEVGHSLHEMTGTVVATNGTRFQPGERVLCVPVNQNGLRERFLVDDSRAIRINTRVSEEEAMLAQPLGTVIFALKKLPNLIDLDVAVIVRPPSGQMFNMCLQDLRSTQRTFYRRQSARISARGQRSVRREPETVCNATADRSVRFMKSSAANCRTSSSKQSATTTSSSISRSISAARGAASCTSVCHRNAST